MRAVSTDRGERKSEKEAGNPQLISSRNSTSPVKKSYSQTVRYVVKQHDHLKAVGLQPSCILMTLIIYHAFGFSATSKICCCCFQCQKKKEVRGTCGIEAMKANRR